jgi:tRNA threonylcarbamoyladenosine biosynthesis protein TsaE
MPSRFSLFLPSDSDTTRLGRALARRLGAGDTVLLEGPVGAGKTHLARAVILALLASEEDVPSPTYTLVQTYDGPGYEIWHADLYRLADSGELAELGLTDAMGAALVLIEWPDRLPPEMVPPGALRIALSAEGEGRRAVLSAREATLARLADLADA